MNDLRGGDPDVMLCAALHQQGSRWCLVVDVWWLAIALAWRGRAEWRHCRTMAQYERWRRVGTPDEALRLMDGH